MTEFAIHGNPTNEEIAAVIAALLQQTEDASESSSVDLWAARGRMTRPSVRPGPGAWRASMMPR